MADDYFERGLAVQRQLFGDLVAADGQPDIPAARVAPDFFPLTTASVFGMLWSRPGLSLRDRELVTVTVLATLGRLGELRGHLRSSLNVGLTRDELVEALMHLSAYAGLPAAVSALDAAAEAFGAGDR